MGGNESPGRLQTRAELREAFLVRISFPRSPFVPKQIGVWPHLQMDGELLFQHNYTQLIQHFSKNWNIKHKIQIYYIRLP